MKIKVFCIYDVKSEAYQQPFLQSTRGQAIRIFMDLISDKNTQIARYPEDFTLFELAEFDTSKGTYENLNSPVPLGCATEYAKDDRKVSLCKSPDSD